MLMQQRTRQVCEGSLGQQETSSFWQRLWKIRCPARVHHFLWRFAHNSHPLFRNVECIGVGLDTRCVICRRQAKDGGHLFLRCKEVKKIWRGCELEYTRQLLLNYQTPRDLLAAVFKLPEITKLRTICLLWSWWTERNKVYHKKHRLTLEALQAWINFLTVEWVEFLGVKEKSAASSVTKWSPPPAEVLKVNVDASFRAEMGEG